MDEEHRCDVHGAKATAFCKVHTILLCTKCLIDNKHKVEDCKISEISEMKDLPSSVNLHLNMKSLNYFIKERLDIKKAEEKSLNDLHEELQKQVYAYYQDLQSKLGEMKQKTLDHLKRSIDRRNTALGRRSDILSESEAMILKRMQDIETEPAKQDIGKIKMELVQLKTKIDKRTPDFLSPLKGKFIPLCKIITADLLGDFEFSDELYQTVDELDLGPSHGDKGSGNEKDKSKKSDSLQPNEGNVRGDEQMSLTTNATTTSISAANFDTIESDDYGSVARKSPPSISSDGDITCESSTPSAQCVIKKIDVLSDKRVVVLDTKHQKLLLLDHDGHIIQEFVENGKSIEMIDFCATKGKLAVLGIDDIGTFISEVVFAKSALKSKGKTYLAADKVHHMLQHVIMFGFDTGILQNTYAIGFADRIVRFKAGNIENIEPFDDKLVVPDPPVDVQSIYDFPKNDIFILDKGNCSLVRYDCKDKKAIWTFPSKNESFCPLAMYHQQVKKYLLLLCQGRIIWICKDSGHVLHEKDTSFSKDLVSFCVDGKDVIAIYGTSAAAFRMTKHPNVLSI